MSEFGGLWKTKTRSIHRRLSSATPSQMTFPEEIDPDFPWEESSGTIQLKKKRKSIIPQAVVITVNALIEFLD